ncbi:MAG: GGDEF domain-containing protein [Desulfobulbaceae bacterium]|nr:GGDEF domain-containing protein [Desulfobulbaceae bacterium]HIJ90620.1 GGDEF domain-containing protein [Deltaproteobacteria bacterium]
MNTAISLSDRELAGPMNLNHLMVELDRYRRQSEWLKQVNELHARLAGATDLQGMIEAFSVWLMPLVEHDLIAYRSLDRSRMHIICSCHGPDRRLAMQTAEEVFEKVDCQLDDTCCAWGPFFVQQWRMSLAGDSVAANKGCLMLLRRGTSIEEEESHILRDALDILGESLQRALMYEDLFAQARRDMLTGLDNRRVFEERVGSMLETARRHDRPITVASMDLDHFKQINDNLGHAAGDDALRMVAKALTAMVRSSDLLVRMGGDEFVLVLPDTSLEPARLLAERLCTAIDGLDLNAGDGSKLGVSIGLVQWNPEMSKDEWLQRADEVLYQAKKAGRSRVCVEEV